MNASQVNETNAYKFGDNFQIIVSATGNCVGVEHNKSEAEAIASYLSNHSGKIHTVVKNPIDCVKAAKSIRRDTVRVSQRDFILKEMQWMLTK